jgi:HSP20 family protein
MFWNMLNEIDELRKTLERNFGEFRPQIPFARFAFLPGLAARQYPLINMYDDAENVYVECLAPGIDPDKLDLTVLRKAITISGEKVSIDKEMEEDAYHRSERATGKFSRTIELKSDILEDNVKAEYKNGLLLITMPKAEETEPRRISITAG